MVTFDIKEIPDDEFDIRINNGIETICRIVSEKEIINLANQIDEILRERRKRRP